MPRRPRNKEPEDFQEPLYPPAKTNEARELQLVAMAMDAAEKQIRDGTVSSQVLTHFLKLGTETHKVELEKLKNESLLAEAKIAQAAAGGRMEALMEEAMHVFGIYKGDEIDDPDF